MSDIKHDLINFSEKLSTETEDMNAYQKKLAWDVINTLDKLIDTLNDNVTEKNKCTENTSETSLKNVSIKKIIDECTDPFGEEKVGDILDKVGIDKHDIPASFLESSVTDLYKKNKDSVDKSLYDAFKS